jgi:hypothetical protein
MSDRSTIDEAAYCRQVANGLAGPDKPFMLKLAQAFDELSERDVARLGSPSLAQ